jgi:hypothetical protein
MHHTRSVLDNTFCGREFIINSTSMGFGRPSENADTKQISRTGFTLSQYLDMLFPTSNKKPARSILDEKIVIDIQTAEKREFTAQGVSMPLKPMGLGKHPANGWLMESDSDVSSTKSSDGNVMTTGNTKQSKKKGERRLNMGGQTMGSRGVAQARMAARECEGKTMRQLSRLWQYYGGQSPIGHGVSMANGMGLGLTAEELERGSMNGNVM